MQAEHLEGAWRPVRFGPAGLRQEGGGAPCWSRPGQPEARKQEGLAASFHPRDKVGAGSISGHFSKESGMFQIRKGVEQGRKKGCWGLRWSGSAPLNLGPGGSSGL